MQSKFCADGPCIPDTLLRARDQGEVIFFCGAGISKQDAKLPNFKELWEEVIQRVPIPNWSQLFQYKTASSENDLPGELRNLSYERRFTRLVQLYRAREPILAEIARALYRDKNINPDALIAHKAILELSRYRNGKEILAHNPVITTNYDNLFVQASTKPLAKRNTKSASSLRRLPQKSIIHLHGYFTPTQIKEAQTYEDLGPTTTLFSESEAHRFVFTGADYGRAYLQNQQISGALSHVVKSRHIVFIGYSADDATISYLLEALADSPEQKKTIYAFDTAKSGQDLHDLTQRWASRGVEPLIAQSHHALWDSILEWADYTQRFEEWAEYPLSIALNEPKSLTCVENELVACLLRAPQSVQIVGNWEPPINYHHVTSDEQHQAYGALLKSWRPLPPDEFTTKGRNRVFRMPFLSTNTCFKSNDLNQLITRIALEPYSEPTDTTERLEQIAQMRASHFDTAPLWREAAREQCYYNVDHSHIKIIEHLSKIDSLTFDSEAINLLLALYRQVHRYSLPRTHIKTLEHLLRFSNDVMAHLTHMIPSEAIHDYVRLVPPKRVRNHIRLLSRPTDRYKHLRAYTLGIFATHLTPNDHLEWFRIEVFLERHRALSPSFLLAYFSGKSPATAQPSLLSLALDIFINDELLQSPSLPTERTKVGFPSSGDIFGLQPHVLEWFSTDANLHETPFKTAIRKIAQEGNIYVAASMFSLRKNSSTKTWLHLVELALESWDSLGCRPKGFDRALWETIAITVSEHSILYTQCTRLISRLTISDVFDHESESVLKTHARDLLDPVEPSFF